MLWNQPILFPKETKVKKGQQNSNLKKKNVKKEPNRQIK